MDSFGSFLRNKRKQKDLSLQGLSDLLSERREKKKIVWYPDVPQLSRWETGKTVPRAKHRDVVKAIADILDMDDSERNELLTKAGLSPLRPDEMDIDVMLSTLGSRQKKSWFLSKYMGWNREQIANKLGIVWFEAMHDIEKTEEELRRVKSETKEETKMEKNQPMLPPWVNQAQWEHLEGREQRGDLVGMEIITYPGGIGIRQQLELFKDCFPEIAPQSRTFGHPLDEIIMAQLHGHLRDEAFWSRAEDFREKAKKCDDLLDAAHAKFTSAGEKLVRLSASGLAKITSGWERQVVYQALGPPLGFKNLSRYLVDIIAKEGGSILTYYEQLYRGPDVGDAEKAKRIHQQLVEDFKQTEEFSLLVGLMKDLQNLRPQILARIDQCLRGREYSYNYCPDCPADQARKMLASKEE